MHTAFFGLPNNSQVIRVRGAAAPRVFLTRITCFCTVDTSIHIFKVMYNCFIDNYIIIDIVHVIDIVFIDYFEN